MFFESHHSTERNYFRISRSINDIGFPLHIHRAFECYAVVSGSAVAVINGIEYTLLEGDAVLIFPYQRHEYKTAPGTSTWVCIFSPDIVGSFSKGAQTVPRCNKFRLNMKEKDAPQDILLQKALCYYICGSFNTTAEYIKKEAGEEDLLSKILMYITKNYTSTCSLENAAREVGYDYSYISKFFKRMTGTSFKSYVNGLRISEACRLLENSDSTVQDISEMCGFSCTRTFNREFLHIVGKTPREYLKESGVQNPKQSER